MLVQLGPCRNSPEEQAVHVVGVASQSVHVGSQPKHCPLLEYFPEGHSAKQLDPSKEKPELQDVH